MKQPLQPPRYFCCGCCTSTKDEPEPKDLESGFHSSEQEFPSLAQIAINTALQYPSNRPSREGEPRPHHRYEGDGEREREREGEGGDVPPSYDAVMKTGPARNEGNEERVRGGDSKAAVGGSGVEGGGNRVEGRRVEQEEAEQELSEVESVRSWGTDSSFEGGDRRGEILTPPSTVFEGEGRERRRG